MTIEPAWIAQKRFAVLAVTGFVAVAVGLFTLMFAERKSRARILASYALVLASLIAIDGRFHLKVFATFFPSHEYVEQQLKEK